MSPKPRLARSSIFQQKSKSKKNNNTIGIIIVVVSLVGLGIFLYCSCKDGDGETFSLKNTIEKLTKPASSKNSKLGQLGIIYFMSPKCPYCKKMNKVLKDAGEYNNIEVIDVTKPNGAQKAKQMGAANRGVPAFISKALKTGAIGAKSSIDELVMSLQPQPKKAKEPGPGQGQQGQGQGQGSMDPSDMVNSIQNMGLVVFTSPSCSWCNKLKSDFQNLGTSEMIQWVDISTPDGKAMVSQLVKDFRGVPVVYSKLSNKSSVGYKPLGNIILELK